MSVIDEYLENVDPPQRAELERIRQTVLRMVPEVEEVISYGMPTFKYKGKNLLHFAAFKDHMSLFPATEPIAELQEKLSNYKTSKGTIQFTLENPLSDALLKEIITSCLSRFS